MMHSKGKTKENSKSVSVKAGRRKKVTSITDVLLFFSLSLWNVFCYSFYVMFWVEIHWLIWSKSIVPADLQTPLYCDGGRVGTWRPSLSGTLCQRLYLSSNRIDMERSSVPDTSELPPRMALSSNLQDCWVKVLLLDVSTVHDRKKASESSSILTCIVGGLGGGKGENINLIEFDHFHQGHRVSCFKIHEPGTSPPVDKITGTRSASTDSS